MPSFTDFIENFFDEFVDKVLGQVPKSTFSVFLPVLLSELVRIEMDLFFWSVVQF